MKKRKITEQEWEEFTLMAIRSVDYPWNLTLEGWYQAVKAEPVIEKTKQNAESRKRSIEKHLNESRRQNAQRRKSIAFGIAARLMQQDRTLRTPRKKANWQGVYGRSGQGASLLRHIFRTSVAGSPKNKEGF
jgi:hypothetical protein